MRICLLSLFVTVLYSPYALGYPSAPGTCNLDKMAIVGHGPSKSTCLDCYGVQIKSSSEKSSVSPVVDIQVTGRHAYQGFLLLVKEKTTNKTVGEFINYDEERFTSVACDDDDEPDYADLDLDKTTVIGHVDPKLKEWPVTLAWTLPGILDKPVVELKLQGMVVMDYENFHILPETAFKIHRRIVEPKPTIPVTTDTHRISTPNATVVRSSASVKPNVEPTQPLLEIEHDAGSVIHQETNALFMWVVSSFICVYLAFSVCYRRFAKLSRASKSQLFTMQSTEVANTSSSVHLQQEDVIPLVSIKSAN